MGFIEQVVAILDGRFPGAFGCKRRMLGQASVLEIHSASRPGRAFLYEPSGAFPPGPDRTNPHHLSLFQSGEPGQTEFWAPTSPDECVRRILPWAFPKDWEQPGPIDRIVEKRRLAKLAEGLATRGQIQVNVADLDPSALPLLGAEERRTLDDDLASLDAERIKRHFPWDSSGRLELKTSVLLNAYPSRPSYGRIPCLAAIGPDRRRDAQEIRVELTPLIPINQTHCWRDRPWLWKLADTPALQGANAGSREADSLQMLDEGRIEDAFSLFGVTLSDELHRLLGAQRINSPTCCAHPDASWTDLLVSTLRQSAPWMWPSTAPAEAERIRRCTGKKLGKGAFAWRLAIFPGQFHSRKASLMLCTDNDFRNPHFTIEVTGSNARLSDTSWKRPIEVDFLRHGVEAGTG